MAAGAQVNRTAGVALVSASGLAASGLTFIVFVLAGRRLSVESFGDFAAIWGLIFGAASILGAFELEAARRSAKKGGALGNLAGLAIAASVLLSVVALVGAPLTARLLATEVAPALAVVLALAFYPMFYVTRGRIAGLDRLGQYALISLLEGLLRPVVLVALGATAAWQFTWATASGAVAWIPWGPSVARASTSGVPSAGVWDESRAQTARKVGVLMSGNVAGAILITGLPATLTLVLGDSDQLGIATAVVLASVSRAPLILLQSVYGLLVPWFVRSGAIDLAAWVRKYRLGLIAGAAAVTLVGAVALAVAIDVLFGGRYAVGLPVAAAFLFGALLLGVVQITTASLVARDLHRLVQIMWWSTTATALFALVLGRMLDLSPVWAAAIGQSLGPLVGLAIAFRALRVD